MVDCVQVFAWLNHHDRSHLGADAAEQLQPVGDETLAPDQRQRAAEAATRTAKTAEDALEQAEIWVRLARFWHGQGQVEQAHACLSDALASYHNQPNQQHRQAVVFWLLGCLEWQQNRNNLACGCWRSACGIFERLAENCEDARQPAQAAWYQQAVSEFYTDLALTPEETYTWLNLFTPSFLGDDLVVLRDHLLAALNQGDYRQAGQLVRYLIAAVSTRHDLDERAEAYLESGLAFYQLLDTREAVSYLKVAVSLYRPRSHQQAVARWMLGLMIQARLSHQADALNQLVRSLDDFRALHIESNQRGQREQAAWYSQRLEILDRAKVRLMPG